MKDLMKGLMFAAAMGVAGTMTSVAHALPTYTTVNAPIHSGEKSVAQILGNTYGGTFTPSGNDLTNGTITAQRVRDEVAGGAATHIGGVGNVNNDDRLWTGTFASGLARARFAGYDQKFGYLAGPSGGSFNELFSVSGSGYGVSGGFAEIDMTSTLGSDPATWRWARSGTGGTWSSNPADNGNAGYDHMVTYQITGLTDSMYVGKTTWMVFFEDLNLGDADYNDLAVELIGRVTPPEFGGPSPTPAPEPATAALGFVGLAGLAAAARRRR